MKTKIIIIFLSIATLVSCSTTRNLPEGETLYTGISEMSFVDEKENASTPIGEEAIAEITAALQNLCYHPCAAIHCKPHPTRTGSHQQTAKFRLLQRQGDRRSNLQQKKSQESPCKLHHHFRQTIHIRQHRISLFLASRRQPYQKHPARM